VVHGSSLSLEAINNWRQRLDPLSAEERRQSWPLLFGREDIIVCGIDILLAVMSALSVPEIIVSDAGILTGVLRDFSAYTV
jgi:exopolyphosphatase/pppGpp-phosphohydrolase